MIKAVAFDVWDTILVNDSDEQKRLELGIPSKVTVRQRLLVREIRAYHPEIGEGKIIDAWRSSIEWSKEHWKEQLFIPSVSARIQFVYTALDIPISPGFYRLISEFETMETEITPRPVEGAVETIQRLSKDYLLGIISDTFFTPGRNVRKILELYGMLKYFKVFVFSDEIGSTKPSGRNFELAAGLFRVKPGEIVHIGDSEERDIAGALQSGFKSVLFTGLSHQKGSESKADAICKKLSQLPEIIVNL